MQYYFAIIKYYIALSAGGGDSRIFQPLFSMSTFQERILAASGSSSSTADTDPELYRYRSASSEEYLESCNYRVWSTELPDRFLVWWMCPVGRDEAEQRSLERELRSDEESPLHIPLEIFMTAYYERYERVKGMASFLSDDCAVGSEDAAAAVEAQLAGDADYRAQAFAFIEGFVCFQQSFSRLGIVRTSSALRSAYRKGSFSTVVFSPRHSSRKRGSAHLA